MGLELFDKINHQNTATAEETSSASEQLKDLANSLSMLIGSFKLDEFIALPETEQEVPKINLQ